VRLVAVVPHGSVVGRVEQNPGIHRGHVPITEDQVVILPVTRRVNGFARGSLLRESVPLREELSVGELPKNLPSLVRCRSVVPVSVIFVLAPSAEKNRSAVALATTIFFECNLN
jgi:hypothetical protein